MAPKRKVGGGLTFGNRLSFSSTRKLDYTLEPGARAFQVQFDEGVGTGVGQSVYTGIPSTGSPIKSRSYSAVIPATGKKVAVSFVVRGALHTDPGASVSIAMVVNGQHLVTHFGENINSESFTVALPFRAKVVDEIRFTAILVAERDAAHREANAMIVINGFGIDSAF